MNDKINTSLSTIQQAKLETPTAPRESSPGTFSAKLASMSGPGIATVSGQQTIMTATLNQTAAANMQTPRPAMMGVATNTMGASAGAGTALPGMAGGGGIGVGVTASGMSNSAASGPDAVAGSLGTDNPQASLLQATREMQETQMSFSLQYLQLQEQSQQENRMFTVFSNYLKNKHEIAKNSIQNMR